MSLNTLKKIEEAVKKRPEELAEARKNGKRVVGWIGYNIPEELIYALGLIPVRLGTGGDDKLVTIGSSYISSKNCVYTRQLVGEFAEKTDPYIVNSDIVALDSTCIQLYRVGEIISYYFNANTVCLGVPRNFYLPEAEKYFFKELEEFSLKLEEFAGTKLDTQRFAESIELFRSIREKIQQLYEFQAGKNAEIGWYNVYKVVQAGYYLDRKQYSLYLSELIEELKEKQGEPIIEYNEGEARVFLAGSVIPPKDEKLIKIIEDLGGRIVGDDLWSGLVPALNVDIKEPTLENLANAYLNRVPHGALPYLDLKTDKRIKNLRKLIDTYKATGVIYHTLRYCDPFSFKANETKNVLKEDKIPFLEIHTEYAGSDIEAVKTRTEAFLEILRER